MDAFRNLNAVLGGQCYGAAGRTRDFAVCVHCTSRRDAWTEVSTTEVSPSRFRYDLFDALTLSGLFVVFLCSYFAG